MVFFAEMLVPFSLSSAAGNILALASRCTTLKNAKKPL